MPGFHIALHKQLSELSGSDSIIIDAQDEEILDEDLKQQVSIVLGARNPRFADDIVESVENSVWIVQAQNSQNHETPVHEGTKLRQGKYALKPKKSSG